MDDRIGASSEVVLLLWYDTGCWSAVTGALPEQNQYNAIMFRLVTPYIVLRHGVRLVYRHLTRTEARRQPNGAPKPRRRRATKYLRWLCAVLFIVCTLPGCTTGSANTGTNASPQPVAQPPDTMTLTIWHSWSGAKLDALNRLARDYEQTYPRVRIHLQAQPAAELVRTYSADVADASAPQLLLLPGRYLGELAERQYIVPLDLETRVYRNLLPAAVQSVQIDGQMYAMPLTFDGLVLFYDRRRGAEPPTRFDQLLVLQPDQAEPPPEQRVWTLGYYLSLEQTLPYLPAFGGTLLDANGAPSFATDNRNATIRWLEWLQRLQAHPAILASPDFSAVDVEIQAGRVTAVIDWTYRRMDYAQVWGTDAVGIAPLPALANGEQPRTMLLPEVMCINMVTSPEQRTAAQAFLRYLTDRSSQTTLVEQSRGQLLPVHVGVEATEQVQLILAAIQASQPLTNQTTKSQVWHALNDMLRNVLLNTMPVPEAVDVAGAAVQGNQ